MVATVLWRLLALVFVCAGIIGVIVPGMPTTVFMLLALWASGHGWPRLHEWILLHPRFGPPIQQWHRYGAIPRQAKILAGISIVVSMGLICVTFSLLWVKWVLPAALCALLFWIWFRPDATSQNEADKGA